MAKHTVADELVAQLIHAGVKRVYGITGDALNAFTNAIREQKEINWITVRHEETAAFAATAEAELTEKLAVCAGTVGPGALHLINGLYNAKRDYCPVLAITGQVPQADAYGPYFQETNLDKAFDDICVFNATVQSAEQIPRIIQQAIAAAIQQRGVAHLAFPTDLIVQKIEKAAAIFLSKPAPPTLPAEQELDELINVINTAKSVSLLVGRGCRHAKAEVKQLAELLQAPVANSLKGSGTLDADHANFIGGIGHVGTPQGLKVMDDCDVLLMLGTDFPYREFLPTKKTIVQIDRQAEHLGRRCEINLGVCGDVGAVLRSILPRLQPKQNRHLKKLQTQRDQWREKTRQQFAIENSKKTIHPQAIIMALTELAADNAIFVADVGEITVWAARYLDLHTKQELIGSFNHGSLGVALAAAIGAQATCPNRQVISLSGDGAFAMLLADLITAARYQLPLTQIVLTNNKFGFVELEMEAAGMPRFATDLVNPDFVKVAEACGVTGFHVEQPEQLLPALKSALNSNTTNLIEVFVNPNELIIPSKIDITTALKFMQGKVREMLIEKDIKVLFKH